MALSVKWAGVMASRFFQAPRFDFEVCVGVAAAESVGRIGEEGEERV
jgi:hypothetical protein